MKRYVITSLVLLVWSLAACTHSHLPRNAPGHVYLEVPPEDMANPEPELPEDPGERMLILSYGVFAGGGVLAEQDSDLAGDYGLGPEVSIELGERKRSHFEDDFFVLPDRSFGLRFGLNVLDSKVDPPGAGLFRVRPYRRIRPSRRWAGPGTWMTRAMGLMRPSPPARSMCEACISSTTEPRCTEVY